MTGSYHFQVEQKHVSEVTYWILLVEFGERGCNNIEAAPGPACLGFETPGSVFRSRLRQTVSRWACRPVDCILHRPDEIQSKIVSWCFVPPQNCHPSPAALPGLFVFFFSAISQQVARSSNSCRLPFFSVFLSFFSSPLHRNTRDSGARQ